MKDLHEVVHRDEQGLISHPPLRAYNVTHYFM
jgi:hypothetical protein